jgi:hypothetical protein
MRRSRAVPLHVENGRRRVAPQVVANSLVGASFALLHLSGLPVAAGALRGYHAIRMTRGDGCVTGVVLVDGRARESLTSGSLQRRTTIAPRESIQRRSSSVKFNLRTGSTLSSLVLAATLFGCTAEEPATPPTAVPTTDTTSTPTPAPTPETPAPTAEPPKGETPAPAPAPAEAPK